VTDICGRIPDYAGEYWDSDMKLAIAAALSPKKVISLEVKN
jgi:hypothetical protein